MSPTFLGGIPSLPRVGFATDKPGEKADLGRKKRGNSPLRTLQFSHSQNKKEFSAQLKIKI